MNNRPRVVLVGGGFGGLNVARGLAGAPISVTLIDKRNYHLFRPMLYQVATGLLSADEISGPLRSILSRQANVEVLMDEVSGVDADKHLVRLKQHSIPFDTSCSPPALNITTSDTMSGGTWPLGSNRWMTRTLFAVRSCLPSNAPRRWLRSITPIQSEYGNC